jgi:hypothetical protein
VTTLLAISRVFEFTAIAMIAAFCLGAEEEAVARTQATGFLTFVIGGGVRYSGFLAIR